MHWLNRLIANSWDASTGSVLLHDSVRGNHATAVVGVSPVVSVGKLGPVISIPRIETTGSAGIVVPYSPSYGNRDSLIEGIGTTQEDWGRYTIYAVLEFAMFSAGSSMEYSIGRAAGEAGKGMALDIFPNTKTIRPLIATSSISGWTASNDTSDARLTDGVPWVVGFTWANGAFLKVFSGPIGGEAKIIVCPITPTGSFVPTVSPDMYIGGMQYAETSVGKGGIDLYSLRVLRSTLSDTAIVALVTNPFQVFAP